MAEKRRQEDDSQSQQIDVMIKAPADWRGETLAHLRAMVQRADSRVVEEVKWKKPSNPMGVPVWSHDGIVCFGNILKNAVRLTFPKSAQLKDPKKIFNTRLDSNMVRAIDIHEGERINQVALKNVIRRAVAVNRLASKPVGGRRRER